jgi:hypothetical protein
MLSSFERPLPRSPRGQRPRRTLKTAQLAKRIWVSTALTRARARASADHRQDAKGTRWMPWHQESMKGVDDCDKPR